MAGHDKHNFELYRCDAFSFTISAVLIALPLIPAMPPIPHPRTLRHIGLEGFAYPYPVSLLPLNNDGEQLRWPIWTVARTADGRILCWLHGRNFPSRYWAP